MRTVQRLAVGAFAIVALVIPQLVESPADFGLPLVWVPWLKLVPGCLILLANYYPSVFKGTPEGGVAR